MAVWLVQKLRTEMPEFLGPVLDSPPTDCILLLVHVL